MSLCDMFESFCCWYISEIVDLFTQFIVYDHFFIVSGVAVFFESIISEGDEFELIAEVFCFFEGTQK